jgi:hypothetical protein
VADHRPLLASLADHLEAIARTLRDHAAGDTDTDGTEPVAPEPNSGVDTSEVVHRAAPTEPVERARQIHAALGSAQAMVVAEVAKAHPRGIKAGDISRALDYGQANTYIVLDALSKHGVVRRDDSVRPYLFYLATGMLS